MKEQPIPYDRRKVHLASSQRRLIQAHLEVFDGNRPTPRQYENIKRAILKIPIAERPRLKTIPSTTLGFDGKELKLNVGFDAEEDLPEGWAVVSMHDSGGNHVLMNAGQAVWTSIWNCWPSRRVARPA